MKKKSSKKANSGITLVALVITIILLLIVAGISIATLTNTGLFRKTKQAEQKSKEAQELENKTLGEYENYISNNLNQKEETNKKNIFSEDNKLYSFTGINDKNATFNITENYLSTNVIGNWYNSAYVGTNEKIDLTGYTKIKCIVSVGDKSPYDCGNWFQLAINDKQNEYATILSDKLYQNQDKVEFEFDIPSKCLNGSYYIGFQACAQDVYVYNIWLEKANMKFIYDGQKGNADISLWTGVKDKNSTYSITENYLSTNVIENSFNLAYVGTNEKIDLTGYTKIKCIVSIGDRSPYYCGNWFQLAINDKQNEYATILSDKLYQNQDQVIFTYLIPTECLNNSYYIGFQACAQNVYVYKIWLEE